MKLNQRGFSILETIAASAIFSIAALGAASAIFLLKDSYSKVKRQKTSDIFVAEMLEEVRTNIHKYQVSYVKSDENKAIALDIERLPYRIVGNRYIISTSQCTQCTIGIGAYIEPSFSRGLFSVTIRVADTKSKFYRDYDFVVSSR